MTGVVRFRLPNRRGTDTPDVIEALDVIEQELRATLGPGAAANQVSPDHIVHVSVAGRSCPAIEPQETGLTAPWPPLSCDSTAGAGIRVAVFDTGLNDTTRHTSPWLNGVTGDPEGGGSPGQLVGYEGHGTFIAGVVRCQAPAADVQVHQFFRPDGNINESNLAARVQAMLDETPDEIPLVISISAGTRSRKDQPLLSLEELWKNSSRIRKNTVIVTAAGNDGTALPFWPAAFPWAVGVGSLDRDGAVSSFSNHGVSADVYALGRNHVNAFPDGTLICNETPDKEDVRVFTTGLARWSGTSFSAPLVAGMIAARITRDRLTPRKACDAILNEAKRVEHPQLGSIFVIPPS
ncbi:MAG: S8 family peptidase [Dermatophilaceae bacterium]